MTAPPSSRPPVVRAVRPLGRAPALLGALLLVAGAAGAQQLGVSPAVVAPGEAVTADWSGGPGRARDWVGVFASGADNRQYLAWRYTGGSPAGTLQLAAPADPGRYELRLLADDGFECLAVSRPFEVRPVVEEPPGGASDAPRLGLARADVVAGGAVTVTFAGAPGNVHDWVGLFPQGGDDHAYLSWQYTDGARQGALRFTAPAEAGRYAFRLFADNGYTRLAASPPLVVSGLPAEQAVDLNGAWTGGELCRAVILQEGAAVTVLASALEQGRWVVWQGDGTLEGRRLRLDVHPSAQARPQGLGEAVATLELAADGMSLSGSLVSPGRSLPVRLGRVAASGGAGPAPAAAPVGAGQEWSATAVTLRGRDRERFVFDCPPGGAITARVWGTGLYTDDSAVCVAAVHAGEVSAANGGRVTIEVLPGESAYRSSTRHGVTSGDWGAWAGSYRFVGPGRRVTVEAPP